MVFKTDKQYTTTVIRCCCDGDWMLSAGRLGVECVASVVGDCVVSVAVVVNVVEYVGLLDARCMC